jgi:hypothetical protein
MNFLKKGPELKLSAIKGVKVPGSVQDVYYDLKDRHLLPIAAILLVALVAVPIALSQPSSEAEESASGEAGASVSGSEARSGELVAKAAPGLRDYRRRLRHLRAKDPFIQQYTGSEAGSGTVESSSESTGSSGAEEGTYTESSSPESSYTPTEPSSGSETGQSDSGKLRYYSYAIDVKVSAGGSQNAKDSEPTVRRNLPELTMLPSHETPAIVYMGSTKDGKKALFVVSSDVDSVFGDAKCVLGSETCQMLAMQPGLPETFVYGGSGKTYKIELLKIHLVETKDLNRAPLGKPKNSGSGQKPQPHGQRLAVGEEAELPAR